MNDRLRAGALGSLLAQVLAAGGQLVLVPLFLVAWGQAGYGEWLTLSAAAAWAAFSDLGLTSHAVNLLNARHARGAHRAFTRTLHSALALSLTFSFCAFVVLTGLFALVPFQDWFGFEALAPGTTAVVGALLALQVAGAVPRGILLGLYRAIGETPRGIALANVHRVLLVAVSAATLLGGGGPVALAAAQLVPLGVTALVALLDLRRRHPEVDVGVRARVPGRGLRLLRPGLGFLAIQGSLLLVLQGAPLALGAAAGAGAVAVFVSLRTLANLVRQVAGSLSNVLWPELTTLAARGERARLRRVHRLSVKLLTSLSLLAAVFLHLAGADLFRLWTRGALPFDPLLLDLLLLHLVLQAPWTASSYVLLATSRHRALARRQMLAAVLGLALGACAAPHLGAPGLVGGLLTAELALCGLAVPRLSCRLLGESWPSFRLDVLGRGVAVAAVLCAGLSLLRPALALAPLEVRLALAAGYAGLGGAFVVWELFLSRRERVALTRVFPLLVRRRRPASGSAHA